ncbi:MAG: putative Zn-dependent protease [Candidatus Deianiraeaceae bacterium]|jgi:predicted Zn-dependent protease
MFFLYVRLLLCLFFASSSFAFELIRDAEIEEYLYDISKPIFRSAGFEKNSIQFYLVKDNSINAFVYGGSNIFVHTGLIESSDTPNMLQGVIAHELGHITGAHIVKMQSQMSKALTTYAFATLLSIGALVANSPESSNVAIASITLGQHIAERNLLAFSRSQEAEADRYAMIFLRKSKISSNGMLELFEKLKHIQKRFVKNIDKYSVTHPLGKQRMRYFKENPSNDGGIFNNNFLQRHRFVQAKILAYSKNDTLYTNADKILENKKYRAYYLVYKNILENQYSESLKNIEFLLSSNPNNPYFHEVASAVYLNLQSVTKARKHLQSAVKLTENNLFLRHELSSFLIKNFNDEKTLHKAVFILEDLKNTKEANNVLYKNLQFAYRKLNMEEHYLISAIEEIVLFDENLNDGNVKVKLHRLIYNLEKQLKIHNNDIIMERLKRVKKDL